MQLLLLALIPVGLVMCVYGWIHNIVSLVHSADGGGAVTIMDVIRALGIVVAPLGVVLGYL